MSWSSGTYVMRDIIIGVLESFPEDLETRKLIYEAVVPALETADWDALEECLGMDEAYDEYYYDIYPAEDYEDAEDEFYGSEDEDI